jgi:hypothetical protein
MAELLASLTKSPQVLFSGVAVSKSVMSGQAASVFLGDNLPKSWD